MKRTAYVFLFVVLGTFVSFIVHAVIEIPAVYLLVKDFETYNLGLTWDQWFLVHHVGAAILFLLGIYFGYREGKRWWRIIYVERGGQRK